MKAIEIFEQFVKETDNDVLGLARNIYQDALNELKSLVRDKDILAEEARKQFFVAENLRKENARLKSLLLRRMTNLLSENKLNQWENEAEQALKGGEK